MTEFSSRIIKFFAVTLNTRIYVKKQSGILRFLRNSLVNFVELFIQSVKSDHLLFIKNGDIYRNATDNLRPVYTRAIFVAIFLILTHAIEWSQKY